MKRERIIGIILVIGAVLLNLWLYRMEPTAAIDPNDNTFQFALVERTNQIFDYAASRCSGPFAPVCMLAYLTDHWVPNWAQGYNLPYYYSHVPQIAIVLSFRLVKLVVPSLSLFAWYHAVIYVLLSLLPLSAAAAMRIAGFSWLATGGTALLSSSISTDGLYGLDPASFLWRGYGLSSQLFAAILLLPAIAAAWRLFSSVKPGKPMYLGAIFLAGAVTAGHLGIGMMTVMSVCLIAAAPFIKTLLERSWQPQTTRRLGSAALSLAVVSGGLGLLLGYWILPILANGDYHNISVWDGIWKFDSFGYRTVLSNLLNGDLFDFGRLPVLTAIILVGVFAAVNTDYFAFALLFTFWILLYFGRTTWGGLFSLIPGMSEFHLSRFIVGVHVAGLFLIPVTLERMRAVAAARLKHAPGFLLVVVWVTIVMGIAAVSYSQTIRYASHNDFLISRANTEYGSNAGDIDGLIATLRRRIAANPGRVFAGRGGAWGKNFRLAETPMYMHLSTYGIPVILWLPETWSPNSDTEQYFSETNEAHYTLYNVRYVATPASLPKDSIQPFWKLVEQGKTWNLYEVETEGYVVGGIKPAVVSSDKEHFRSVVRLWMHSAYPEAKLFPELTFDAGYPKTTGVPNFRMVDETTYVVPGGTRHNLLAEIPRYLPPTAGQPYLQVSTQRVSGDMEYRATVTVPQGCTGCVTVLKQSFHPSWTATVNGKTVRPVAVFPFHTAVPTEAAGTYDVVFSYRPDPLKTLFLVVSMLSVAAGIILFGSTLRRP